MGPKTSLASNNTFHDLFEYTHLMVGDLLRLWQSPGRFYHSFDNHLAPMIDKINQLPIDFHSKELLEIAAWFHDCIYDPKSDKNELNSVKFFIDNLKNKRCADANIIKDIIEMTVDFKHISDDVQTLQAHFANLDLDYLRRTDVGRIVQNELLMLKEFQFMDYSLYVQRRIEILTNLRYLDFIDCVGASTIDNICGYLSRHRPKVGIYPGSFNPFHVGHLSILQEAEKMFDKVIVAMGTNPEKCSRPENHILQRVKEALPYHQVAFFDTFLHKYIEEKSKDADVTVIRGFRSGYDIDYELTNLAFIRDMSKDLKMIFIAPQKKFDHISSSAIRLIKNFEEKQSKVYIPKVYYPSS